MPFKSEKQRRYLWANEPEVAKRWSKEEKKKKKGVLAAFKDGGKKLSR